MRQSLGIWSSPGKEGGDTKGEHRKNYEGPHYVLQQYFLASHGR
jgi:hypothetical protein